MWVEYEVWNVATMKTIFLSVPLGYYARYLLRSGVMDFLLRDPEVRIVVLTPAYRDQTFVQEFQREERVFFENLREMKRAYYPPSDPIGRALYKGMLVTHPFRRLFLQYMKFMEKVFMTCDYETIFKKYQPNLIVTCSPGFHSNRDIPLIKEAKGAKIPTLCVVLSWDNLLTCGLMPTRPDRLLVWNEMMKEEAIALHYYPPEKVCVTGPPGFDFYQDPHSYLDRKTFFQKRGLDPAKKLVTVATSPTGTITNQTFILDTLLEGIKRNCFAEPVQILCRIHPKSLQDRSVFEPFHAKGVHVDFPGRYSQALQWDPDRSEMASLANTLRQTDVLVTVASTVAVEAAIVDTPIVLVAYDPEEPEKFKKRVVVDHYQKHYRYIIESEGVRMARDETELFQRINDCLKDRALDRLGRRALAEKICFSLDGRSSERTAGKILEVVKTSSTSKIRILYLIESLGRGGAERRLVSDLRQIDRRFFEPVVYHLFPAEDLKGEIESLGVPVHWLGLTRLTDLPRGMFALLRFIRKSPVDLIHTQLFGADVAGRVVGRLLGIPVVSTLQSSVYEPGIPYFWSPTRRWIDRWTGRWCNRKFIAVSEFVKQSASKRVGFRKEDIIVITNAVDPEEFVPSADGVALRKRLGFVKGDILLISVGKMNPPKGHLYLIEALPKIISRFPHLKLLLVGDGPSRKKLERVGGTLGLKEHLFFLGERKDVKELLAISDFFVFPTLSEGMPLALLEAMAMEKPCIASNIPPIREVVEDGKTGLLVTPKNPEAIREAVLELLEDPQKAAILASQGRKFVTEKFHAEKNVRFLEDFYQDLLRRRKCNLDFEREATLSGAMK